MLVPTFLRSHSRHFQPWALALLTGLSTLGVSPAAAQSRAPAIHVDGDGTVHADGVTVPVSEFLSPQARALIAARLQRPAPPPPTGDLVVAARAKTEQMMRGFLAQWQAISPATITPMRMGGVQTDVVVPASGIAPENAHRVLINLHGGGFFTGARTGGQVESVPLAVRGRIKVVTVDYRLAPEARFPAASEDVESVYRALLKTYKPENIGIYGCSAGGTLVAQSLAWFQRSKLPRPGAAGIFCSGAMPGFWYGGDSFAVTQMMNAQIAVSPAALNQGPGNLYMDGSDPRSALAAPALFPEVLAQFPPTLLVTGTRDTSMSNALVTNVRLLEAGAETQLLVLEGTGHGEFDMLPGTPEATQAFDLIWRFFDKHLAR
jgi:acetyl esterase/lipase